MVHAVVASHAAEQMRKRGISEQQVREVLALQEEIVEVRPGRVVVQAVIPVGDPSTNYLVRVFVDIDRTPPQVVTAYRTSRIAKYRSIS
ncbi:MAG: DUF4258 domain-containing protein [Thermodesulfobacteriota bacterium]